MSNNDSLVLSTQIELLISEMGMAPLSDEEYSTLMEFVDKIFITEPTIVNGYGNLYQTRFANFSGKVTEIIKSNQSITDTQKLIDEVLSTINNFNEYRRNTSNPSLVQASYAKAINTIRKCSRSLRNSKIVLETNIGTFKELLSEVRTCEYWISMYLLAGKIKINQVNALLASYRSGDKSRIKNAIVEALVIQSIKSFESKLESLECTRTSCMQYILSIQMEITNNNSAITAITSILSSTIPAFEHTHSLF